MILVKLLILKVNVLFQDDRMTASQLEIEVLKKQLIEEQQIVKQKEMYEEISKQIMQYSDPIESQNRVDGLKAELEVLERTALYHEHTIQVRKSRFTSVVEKIHQLQNEISGIIEYREPSNIEDDMAIHCHSIDMGLIIKQRNDFKLKGFNMDTT